MSLRLTPLTLLALLACNGDKGDDTGSPIGDGGTTDGGTTDGGTTDGGTTDGGTTDGGATGPGDYRYDYDEDYGLVWASVERTVHEDGSESLHGETVHDYDPYLELAFEVVEDVELGPDGFLVSATVHMESTVGTTTMQKRFAFDPANDLVVVQTPAGTVEWTVDGSMPWVYYLAISDPIYGLPMSSPIPGWVLAQAVAADTVLYVQPDGLATAEFAGSGAPAEGTIYMSWDVYEIGDFVEAVDMYGTGLSLSGGADDLGEVSDLEVAASSDLLDWPACSDNSLDSDVETFTVVSADGMEIHGQLDRPSGSTGPLTTVVFNAGTGGADRDQSIGGLPRWTCLAEALLADGYAVVRYDDRAHGETGGNYSDVTYVDRTEDATAVAAWAAGHDDVDLLMLLGHSEGVSHACETTTALRETGTDIDALLLVSGIGGSAVDLWNLQLETLMRNAGLSEATIAQALEDRDGVIADIEGGLWHKDTLGGLPIEFWEQFIALDGGEVCEAAGLPAAIFQGGEDWQVDPVNAEWLETALLDGGSPLVDVYRYDGMGHLMSPIPADLPSLGLEYYLPIPWDATFVGDLVGWVGDYEGLVLSRR